MGQSLEDELVDALGDARRQGLQAIGRGERRCRHCLGTIPPPRRRYCSEFCAGKGKLALQDWRRRRARG